MEGEEIIIPDKYLSERVEFYHDKTIPYLKFIRCQMSKYHQSTYDEIILKNGTLPPDGQTLLDLILPNPGLIPGISHGLFRSKDIKYSLSNSSQEWNDKYQISIEKSEKQTLITGEFMKYNNLKKYSTKYVKLLDSLFHNLENDGGKVIINHQYVKMSGVLFIQEVLKRNGFIDEYASSTDETLCSICGKTRILHTSSQKKIHEFLPARFISYHGDIDKNTLDSSLEKFKSIDSKDGYLYRILIGSKIINEGIDFNAVRNIYVMVCPTNIPTLIQILGRAIRKNSHITLDLEKRKVIIKLFVSTMDDKKELSYEEKKYFEKSQDYLIIQKIEKIFNESAIDAITHRSMIMPTKTENELGALYFEPNGFSKKVMDLLNSEIDPKELSLSTFRAFHSDEEIELIIYIIKRLFVEQSAIWKYEDLWSMVKNPPFDLFVNPKLFLEENFIIALNLLSDNSIDIYKVLNRKSNLNYLFNHLDKTIKEVNSNNEYKIIYYNDYYILFPIISGDLDSSVDKHSLGISSTNLSGYPDIDFDSWYRTDSLEKNNNFRITKYLKTSKISYDKIKYKFYNQYKDYKIEELPISTEIYDVDFHNKLLEDCIVYAFNILTDINYAFSELHEFYFKMLYFYDKLDLIIFANHLEQTKYYEYYKKYITKENIKITRQTDKKQKEIIKEDNQYNAFLMSSIIKTNEPINFNIARLNDFIAQENHNKNIKEIPLVKKNVIIRKVYSNILPVGHLLNTSDETGFILSVPKIYIPEIESNRNWMKIHDLGKSTEVLEKENDLIIGYYEKNPIGIDSKFKLRLPSHKTKIYEDTRLIERGIVCNSKKKEELIDLIKKLNIKHDSEVSVKSLCDIIKLELMNNEITERRKYRHMTQEEKKKYKRIKWFYLSYESQIISTNNLE